jgi:hypothetical protein
MPCSWVWRSRKSLTSLVTEHGFAGNLKAILAGFSGFFGCGIGRERSAGAEAQKASGEEGGYLAEAFFWRKESGGKVVSHARSPVEEPAATVADKGSAACVGNGLSTGYLLGARGN